MFLSPVNFLSKLAKGVLKSKFKLTHLFHKEKNPDDDFAGTGT